MPDSPISTTLTLALKQWGDKKNPGFEALNDNYDRIDAAVMNHGVEFPAEYQVDKLFFRDDEAAVYRNDGTQDVPVWTLVLSLSEETAARILADETLQDNIDSNSAADQGYALALVGTEAAIRAADDVTEAGIRAAADVAEASARAAEDLTLFKKDGTRAMTGAIDGGAFKATNFANGDDPQDLATVAQLEAAVAAGLGVLGVYENLRAHTSVDIGPGTSPQVFEANTHDEITDGDMHSTSSNKDRFIAQQDALYQFQIRFKMEGWYGATIQWYKNGTLADECKQPESRPATGSNITYVTDTLMISLVAGDYVTVKVYGLSEPDSGKILADSSIRMFALSANGVGGGDFFADGHVPMTGDLDGGGNKGINFEDGVAATDLATVGQTEDLVDDAITAADIPGQIAAEVASELTGIRLLEMAEPAAPIALHDTIAAHNVFQDIPGGSISLTLDYAQRVTIHMDAFGVDDGSNNVLGQFHFQVIDSASAVTGKDGPATFGGNDVNYAASSMTWITGVLPAGPTLIKLQVKNPVANSKVRHQVTNFQAGYFN